MTPSNTTGVKRNEGNQVKARLKQMLSADNSFSENKDIAMYEFGLSRDKHYDVLVVAPGWKPTKIMVDYAHALSRLT